MRARELFTFLKKAVEEGANKALTDSKVVSNCVNKTQAYRQYGRSNIDRWIQEGILTPQSDQSPKILFQRSHLEAIAASSNRKTYLQVTER
ncbi:hypothetical protein [Sphingobacterium mizutaii]|uniref:hypothetical protein n=1 Tax=Sphingobacterium mizutaii TaxID=1010 RepID=UPI00162AF240|nr:hypothetical protein [Sphingobacterium mizutaii]